MGIPVASALVAALELLNGIRNAIAAGRQEVTEEELDDALAKIAASDNALSDAIARARAREADGG